MHKKALIILIAAILVPIITIGSGFLFYKSLSSAIMKQAKQDELHQADAIIIFGAAIGYKGRPSAVLRARIIQGLKLYRAKKAGFFILTGGIGWGPPAESVVMKKVLSGYGVPDEKMFFETQSKTTYQQVQFAINHMRKQGWKKALLVSDPIHMYRLKKYFSHTKLTLFAAPTRSIVRSLKKQRNYVQLEIIKYLAYLLLGE